MKRLYRKLFIAMCTTLVLAVAAEAANLSVDCRPGGKGITTISAAVRKIAAHSPLGPNTITVTGNCVENVAISSLDNLTVQASSAGASITDASSGALDTVAIGDANRFALNGFTINGSVDCFDSSVCRLAKNTIQNSQTGYGLRVSRSQMDSVSDSVSNNPSGPGVLVANQSRLIIQDDLVSNNGGHGIQVSTAGFVQITSSSAATAISNNAGHGILATSHGTVFLSIANVSGNGGDGIRVQDGSVLRTGFVAPTVNQITNNGAAGVNVGDLSHAFFAGDGSVNVSANLGGTDVYCAGQFAATRNVASVGGTTNCAEPNPELPKRK